MKIKSKAKLIKGILSGIWWAILCLLAVCIVSILGAKVKGKVPSVFGYSVLHIISGSMETEIPQGSYVLIKAVDPQEVKTLDVICFYSDDPQIYGMPNTHRVMERVETENGLRFVTKGDANPINDVVEARAERLIGVYVKTLSGMTAFANFLDGKGTFVILIVAQIATAAIAVYVMVAKKQSNEQENEDNSEE